MSKFKLAKLALSCLILAFSMLVATVCCQDEGVTLPNQQPTLFPSLPFPLPPTRTVDSPPQASKIMKTVLPIEINGQPATNTNPEFEKLQSPSWNSLSLDSGVLSVIGKTSALAKTIVITKITPSIGEIILNNTNKTMPVNVSGWHLEILSISHPKKEVISNRSVIPPMGQFTVRISPLDNSGVATVYDSTGKTVDRIPYSGNWTRPIGR